MLNRCISSDTTDELSGCRYKQTWFECKLQWKGNYFIVYMRRLNELQCIYVSRATRTHWQPAWLASSVHRSLCVCVRRTPWQSKTYTKINEQHKNSNVNLLAFARLRCNNVRHRHSLYATRATAVCTNQLALSFIRIKTRIIFKRRTEERKFVNKTQFLPLSIRVNFWLWVTKSGQFGWRRRIYLWQFCGCASVWLFDEQTFWIISHFS